MLTSATGPAGCCGFPLEPIGLELPQAPAVTARAVAKNRTCSCIGDSEEEVPCVYPPVGLSCPAAGCATAAAILPRCGAPPGTPGRFDSGPPGRSAPPGAAPPRADRKSTRLNSSHLVISYAVFCLKK